MSAKIFIKGDYRHLFIDNSNATDYKVFYDNQYNNIQTKDDIVKSLGKNEKYVDNYVVKVFNNGVWVDLALLENYFNENEVRKSVFYRILTESNFEFNKRGISSTNIDMRLALNNLKIVCKINENFEFENSDCVVYDSKKAFLKKIDVYNRNLFYDEKNKDLFDSNQYALFGENGTTIDYQYFANLNRKITFNSKNNLNNYTVSENDSALLKEIVVEIVDLLFNKNSNSLVSNENVFFDETETTIDYYFKSPAEKQIVFNNKNNLNNYTVSENDSALLKEIVVEIVDLLFNKNSNSLVSNENVFFDETETAIDYYFKSPVENKIVFNSKNKLNDYVVSEENTVLLKEITTIE